MALSGKAIVSMSFGGAYSEISDISFPTIAGYAEKIGADFIPLSIRRHPEASPHWEKLQLHDILGEYDRVIWMDSDLIVRSDTPDLFEIVPADHLGAVDEMKHSLLTATMIRVQSRAASDMKLDIPPPSLSWNSGVMVLGKMHRPMFVKPTRYFGGERFYDQAYLNVMSRFLKFPVFDPGCGFNDSAYCHRESGSYDDRHKAYIIHYCGTAAGCGYYALLNRFRGMAGLMKHDLDIWRTR